jgi:hypothetical protein
MKAEGGRLKRNAWVKEPFSGDSAAGMIGCHLSGCTQDPPPHKMVDFVVAVKYIFCSQY